VEISGRGLGSDASLEVIEVRALVLASGTTETLEFNVEDLPGPLLRARVRPVLGAKERVHDWDANPADSVRWAHAPTLEPIRVAVVGQASVPLVAALISDPFISLLEPLDAPKLDQAQVVIFSGVVPEVIQHPTLILNPPVGPGRWGARGTIEDPEFRVPRHKFWRDLHPGELSVGRVGYFEPRRRGDGFLWVGDKAIATLSTEGGRRVIQVGLDPGDPSWFSDLTYPAVLARCVDLLYDRVDDIGRSHTVGSVSLLPWSNLEQLTIDPLHGAHQEQPILGSSVWIPRSGVFLLSSAGNTLRPIVVGFQADDHEDLLSGRHEVSGQLSFSPVREPERSDLWLYLLLALLSMVILDRWLFVSRRVV